MGGMLIFAHFSDVALEKILGEVATEDGHRVQLYRTWAATLRELEAGSSPDLLLVDSSSLPDLARDQFLNFFRSRSKTQARVLVGPQESRAESLFDGLRNVQAVRIPHAGADAGRLIRTAVRQASRTPAHGGDDASRSAPGSRFQLPGRDAHGLVIEELDDNRFFLALSPAMLEIYRQVKLLQDIDVSVLILGESGTGKEIVAHLLHKYSRRAQQKFVNVNCAALPVELLESELFGHVKGAFTGAITDRPGRFEQANGGTILLDEIGEIGASMQAKLLHVLQDGQFTRLGARQPTRVDVHVLAATNISIEQALAAKTFREDLYYRLNMFTFNVPPLRERSVEIPYLVNEIVARTPLAKRAGVTQFPREIVDLLPQYNWPGNLRELRNFILRALIMQDDKATLRELEAKIAQSQSLRNRDAAMQKFGDPIPMRTVVRDVRDRTESRIIEEALHACAWNRRDTARALNISYRALLYKIDQYGLNPRKQRMTA